MLRIRDISLGKEILKLIIGVWLMLVIPGPAHSNEVPAVPDTVKAAFELQDHDGETVTQESLQGKFVLLAFGFTHCEHICPMMVANMGLALKLAPQNSVGVFISVDTERDTAATAHSYASNFHQNMIGLSGSYEQIREAANNFNVSFVVTKSHKAYTVEHTSDIFVIGPEGQLIDTFAMTANPADIAAAMKP